MAAWYLFLEPVDVWRFRDGRPFVAGEAHQARSIFPPTPYTLQGAIRAKVLFDAQVDLALYAYNPADVSSPVVEAIGAPGAGYGRLRIQGPALARMEGDNLTLFYPVPADVVGVEEGGKYSDDSEQPQTVRCATLAPLRQGFELRPWSNLPVEGIRFLWARFPTIERVSGWIRSEDLIRCLTAEEQPFELRIYNDAYFYQKEHRIGIQINPERLTTEEGKIYRAEFLRFNAGAGLCVCVEGIAPFREQSGYLQLGGEARAAQYRILPKVEQWIASSQQPLPKRFKVVFLTPAYFAQGWQTQDWSAFFDGATVRLVGAAVNGYQMIGGAFSDDRRRRSNFERHAHRFLPAGSVLFFETAEEGAVYTGEPITETPSGADGNLGHIGFGTVAIGKWN